MKKKQRLFVIENFQLLQFINVIIFTLYHIFWISANILSDGIVELIKKEVLNLRELSESEIYLKIHYHYYIIMIIIFLILMKPRNY